MAGTVIITGANGSLAVPAVANLLTKYPDLTALLTVRNASDADTNTARLRATIARFPNAKTSIHELDLAALTAVHKFADDVAAGLAEGRYPPLKSIICNAFHWNLVAEGQLTADGFEKTFQINHIAHAALVLRLVGSFSSEGGRIVTFASNAHWPGKNSLEKYPPSIPEDLSLLVQVNPDKDYAGRGFQRYANSKLAAMMFTYALDRRLEKDPTLGNITAIVVDVGSLSDSRALRTNTPTHLQTIQRFVLQPLRPIIRFADPTLRTSAKAGADVLDLALGQVHPGERGYFDYLRKAESSPESRDEGKQERVWAKTVEWAGITKENSRLGVSAG